MVNGRWIGKRMDGVLESLSITLESERAIFSAEVAVSELDATADSKAISVVVFSVIEAVELLLVSAEAKALWIDAEAVAVLDVELMADKSAISPAIDSVMAGVSLVLEIVDDNPRCT